MKKQFLQILFTILTMGVMMHGNVLAASNEFESDVRQYDALQNEVSVASVTIGDEISYADNLEDAFLALAETTEQDKAVLTLLDDIDLGDDGIITRSGVFTLDLNGHTINSDTYTIDVRNETDENTTKVFIQDSSTEKNGKILTREGSCMALNIWANVILESGTIEGTDGAVSVGYGGQFILMDGVVQSLNSGSGIYVHESTLIIKGGQINTSEAEILCNKSIIDMSDYDKAEGIRIHFDSNAKLDSVQIPDALVVLDEVGNPATTIKRGYDYRIGVVPDTTYYPVWIGDEQVSGKHMNGDGWSYDLESNTLTLDNYQYTGLGHSFYDGEAASLIYADTAEMTIVLKGENKLTHQLDENTILEECFGILTNGIIVDNAYVGGVLTIKGNGTLTIDSVGIEFENDCCGIMTDELNIEDCTLDLKIGNAERNYGIKTVGMSIKDAIVKILCAEAVDESIGICARAWNNDFTDYIMKDINIIDSTVTILTGLLSDEGESCAVYGNLKVDSYTNGYEWKVSEDSETSKEELAYNKEQYFSIEPLYINAFADVPEDAFYANAVKWAVKNKIAYGTTASTFAPNASCTRAEAVTFLWRSAGSPNVKDTALSFTDVSKDAFYYKAVLWAVENGIVYGNTADTFAPNEICTRAHVVSFLWRYQKTPTLSAENPFIDVDENAYYNKAVVWAVKAGITYGTTATTFSPDNNCTRAEIVTFLYRCLSN